MPCYNCDVNGILRILESDWSRQSWTWLAIKKNWKEYINWLILRISSHTKISFTALLFLEH